MESLLTVWQLLRKKEYMMVIDLKSAYFHANLSRLQELSTVQMVGSEILFQVGFFCLTSAPIKLMLETIKDSACLYWCQFKARLIILDNSQNDH